MGLLGVAVRPTRQHGRLALAALALVAAGCSDSLVDHRAGDAVLHPSPCDAGQVLCGDVCVQEDAGHCGPSCTSCPAPADPNAGPSCTEAHACGAECVPGFLHVDEACERAVAVSAGFAHTCAVTTGGRLKCWGANEHGQLGDGTTTDRAAPVDVALPAAATAVAAGYVHTCAVAGGAVWCWGDNSWGAWPHEEFLITCQEYSYTFRLRALDAGEDPAEDEADSDCDRRQ